MCILGAPFTFWCLPCCPEPPHVQDLSWLSPAAFPAFDCAPCPLRFQAPSRESSTSVVVGCKCEFRELYEHQGLKMSVWRVLRVRISPEGFAYVHSAYCAFEGPGIGQVLRHRAETGMLMPEV